MFTLRIKTGWYHMILHGYKKEIYKDIKPYNTIRFKKLFGYPSLSQDDFLKMLDGSRKEEFTSEMLLKNGYDKDSPCSKIGFTLEAREGNPDWGAEKGQKYYVLKINSLSEIIPADIKGKI